MPLGTGVPTNRQSFTQTPKRVDRNSLSPQEQSYYDITQRPGPINARDRQLLDAHGFSMRQAAAEREGLLEGIKARAAKGAVDDRGFSMRQAEAEREGLLEGIKARAAKGAAGMKRGGPVKGKGTKTSDDVPIMASNGEFVVNADAADYAGPHFMDALNKQLIPQELLELVFKASQGFAGGGFITEPRQRAGNNNVLFNAAYDPWNSSGDEKPIQDSISGGRPDAPKPANPLNQQRPISTNRKLLTRGGM